MMLRVDKAEFWSAEFADRVGGLATLLKAIGNAGADLKCVYCRQMFEKPGWAKAFLTPIEGRRTCNIARHMGFERAKGFAALRVEGPDRPGMGGRLAQALAEAGVDVRGVTMVVRGRRFVAYVGFENSAAAARATKVLRAFP